MSALPSTLHKEERIYSKKLIDALFQGGRSRSISAFPLRVVYMEIETDNPDHPDRPQTQMLISVPKRCFKRAVKRNRVKRQVREAYRRNKQIVCNHRIAMAFIWLDDQLHPTEKVESRVVKLLSRINEQLQKNETSTSAHQ